MITLQDVAVLTGLSIDGHPIIVSVHSDYLELCESLLGTSLKPPNIHYSLVRSSWFKEHFAKLPPQAN